MTEPMRITVRGGSMSPTLEDGDEVLVDVDAHPRIGDVVLVLQHGATVLHRVVALAPQLITAGDATRFFDDAVEPIAILGVARVPRLSLMSRARLTLRRLRIRLGALRD